MTPIIIACEILIIAGKAVTVCPLPSERPQRCEYVRVCDNGACKIVEVCK